MPTNTATKIETISRIGKLFCINFSKIFSFWKTFHLLKISTPLSINRLQNILENFSKIQIAKTLIIFKKKFYTIYLVNFIKMT